MKKNKLQFFVSLALITVLVLSVGFINNDSTVSATTTVKIGQACNDENGKTKGGKAGDQTGGEVCTSKWSYSSKSGAYNNWKYVIRAKDAAVAKKMAKAMLDACNNKHIGYDQTGSQRITCQKEAVKVKYAMSKITNDCETTCSQLVGTCVCAGGIDVFAIMNRKDYYYWDNSMVYADLKATGKFTIYTASDYTTKSSLLRKGDILVSPGKHSAMVVDGLEPVDSTSKKVVTKKTSSKVVLKVGREYKLLKAIYVRKGPGKKYAIKKKSQLTKDGKKHACKTTKKAKLKKNTVVTCIKKSGDWIKIPSGWMCAKKGNVANAK